MAQDGIEDRLTLVRCSGVVVEVGDVVAGLVAVCILPDEARDVTRLLSSIDA